MNQETIDSIQSIKTAIDNQIKGLQAQSDSLTQVLEVATTGWQSDTEAISQAKADQKAADIAALNN